MLVSKVFMCCFVQFMMPGRVSDNWQSPGVNGFNAVSRIELAHQYFLKVVFVSSLDYFIVFTSNKSLDFPIEQTSLHRKSRELDEDMMDDVNSLTAPVANRDFIFLYSVMIVFEEKRMASSELGVANASFS